MKFAKRANLSMFSESELLSERTISIDKRVVRLETIIEIAEKQVYLPKE